MDGIIIQRIDFNTLDHSKINNNNLPKDSLDYEAMAKNYSDEVVKTHLNTYYKLVNYPVKFEYEFTEDEINILKESAKVSIITAKRNSLMEDELMTIENRLKNNWIDGKYFIRFDSGSPKDGYPKFPLMSAANVIDIIITSHRAFKAMNNDNKKIYFVEFNESWESSHEVRVFVRKGKVTCISQYNPYNAAFFNEMTDLNLKHITQNIISKVNQLVKLLCDNIKTYDFVVDLYIEDDYGAKLIELNSFGYWLSSGSALFNWNDDRTKLYGDGNIYFRILI